MSTQPIRDYLTKQLVIEKNIVTYRSLSRALSLHVNVAKNELADFHANEGQNVAATYLLSGAIQPAQYRIDEDVDMEEEYPDDDDADGEGVPQTEIVLVGERELESAQSRFFALDTIHIYSLSPSPIRDAGLLCTPTDAVRNIDQKKGSELAAVVGKVVSAQVIVSTKPLPSWGGRKAPPPVAGPSKSAAAASTAKKDENAKSKEKETKPEKPKATGKLDFSKAKTKAAKEEEKPAKAEAKTQVASKLPSTSTIGEKVQAKMAESKKRGIKRKSALESDSEDEDKVVAKPAQPATQVQSSVRVHRGAVLSDDEDDAPQPVRKGKGKATASNFESEAEKDLHALMDIDDGMHSGSFFFCCRPANNSLDAVTRASHSATAAPEPPQEPAPKEAPVADSNVEMSDVEMSDGNSKPAPAKAKRKPKKVVPVGQNGLKKKRIVKSRFSTDDKGYMVTEDYSEYESVDEEEPPPPPKGKTKAKAKPVDDAAPAKAKAAPNPPAKPKPKAKPSGGSSKAAPPGGIASFFGKSKSK
ncbi:DNA polymerase subunit Cdc27 [Mycena pura]|uniref:DNA polymerase delta subunit 3 n=1 Tax=Mycena pura TaxID=153505 RepID=A0AAD6YLH9_9AGAR|nr:DNA polymerase subunit Cdc27 [Mycena pura]